MEHDGTASAGAWRQAAERDSIEGAVRRSRARVDVFAETAAVAARMLAACAGAVAADRAARGEENDEGDSHRAYQAWSAGFAGRDRHHARATERANPRPPPRLKTQS
jgi:hypothetical protein